MYHYYILLFIFMTFKLIVYNINVLKQRSMTQSAPLTFHLKMGQNIPFISFWRSAHGYALLVQYDR